MFGDVCSWPLRGRRPPRDWEKKNPEWEGVCVSANSVLSNRQARAATKAFVKARLGMTLSESETRSLPQQAPVATAAE
jgi:DNA sulfur modification protein DndB